jgi:splicing factor U2AF subunit
MAAMQQQAMMSALLQQQAAPAVTRRARQLHVGNLPPGLTGEEPEELFKTMMQVMHSLLPSAAALGRCPRPLLQQSACPRSRPLLSTT